MKAPSVFLSKSNAGNVAIYNLIKTKLLSLKLNVVEYSSGAKFNLKEVTDCDYLCIVPWELTTPGERISNTNYLGKGQNDQIDAWLNHRMMSLDIDPTESIMVLASISQDAKTGYISTDFCQFQKKKDVEKDWSRYYSAMKVDRHATCCMEEYFDNWIEYSGVENDNYDLDLDDFGNTIDADGYTVGSKITDWRIVPSGIVDQVNAVVTQGSITYKPTDGYALIKSKNFKLNDLVKPMLALAA